MLTEIGRYRVVRKLGEGGMGEVYLASDELLRRQVAIKVIQSASLMSPGGKARFLREARSVAALNHPGIAVLYEAGETDGQPYLVMEYVEGRTLREETRAGTIAEQRLIDLARQLVAALEHAHSRGILHRDIKSSNIILTPDARIKLLDFGLAKAFGEQEDSVIEVTRPGTWVGTLAYVAPEVLMGHNADERSDIYSVGVVMYEMACGQTPVAGLDSSAVMAAILHGQFPAIRSRNPALSPALVGLIERAMARSPGDRFAGAAELHAVLLSLSAGHPSADVTAVSPARSPVLAVMDFQNVSGDPSVEWLGAGLAETLTSDLQKLTEVRVVSRERVQVVIRKGSGGPADASLLKAIGEELGARWVITGSFQRAGDRLRITPRLLEVDTGEVAAAGKVDGHWEDIFSLQDRVVAQLMESLEVRLDSSAMKRIAAPETLRLDAYELYVRARQRFYELGKSSLEEARQLFERVIELDPNYALAFSGLGATHAMRFIHRGDPDDLSRSSSCLERALELDPEIAEPYPWLCYVYSRRGKIEEAIRTGRKGVQLQPDLVQAHYFLAVAHLLETQRDPGSYQPAVDSFLQASRVEPRWEPTWLALGWLAMILGRNDVATGFLEKALELEREGRAIGPFPGSQMGIGSVLLRLGEWEKALQSYSSALEVLQGSDHMLRESFATLCHCGLGDVRLRMGDPGAALLDYRRAWRIFQEFVGMLGRQRIRVRVLAGMASSYAGQGETGRATELAREASELIEETVLQPQTWIWDMGTCQLFHALAGAWLRLDDPDRAIQLLEQAVAAGWRDADWLSVDPEFARLSEDLRFVNLIEIVRQAPAVNF